MRSISAALRHAWCLLPVLGLFACGTAGVARSSAGGSPNQAEAFAPPPLPGAVPTGAEAAPTDSAPREEIYAVSQSYALDHEAPVAAAEPQPAPDRAPPLQQPRATATDAVQPGPILIYAASFLLSVYEVEKTQDVLIARVRELGGFLGQQTDTQLHLRVPAANFEAALRAVESAGKVRARNVQALDVGDEYRDVLLRLRTAELMHQRFEAMLARADKVSDALAVQAELERIVREIERLKAQLRGMNDRIAYSTIVVEFRPEQRPDLDDSDVFKLPFGWLDELGLHHLLELAP